MTQPLDDIRIALTEDRFIPLREVPRCTWMPKGPCGERLHVSTIHRWRLRGVRGVRLQAWKVGRSWCTTEAALLRFIERTSSEPDRLPPLVALSSDVKRAAARAQAILNGKRGAA